MATTTSARRNSARRPRRWASQSRARGEWRLLAACHNLRKIFRHIGTAGLAAAIG
ncbi:hypothetical protein ACFYTG_38745 [Streptomyces mirabilis]|uniref:hypothetical protein n=1 Tax=Streptomyces mirabilis TaxID=68239 RepID=UPI0036AF6DCE